MPAVPYELAKGSWDDPAVKEDFARKVIDTISGYAPNSRHAVIDKHVLTPVDVERLFGNHNRQHIDVRPDQMFGYRPMPGWSGCQTPMANLHFGGASCHGGPGVSGISGHNVARSGSRTALRRCGP